MRKERVETLVESFIDENDDLRYFVIAAVSVVLDKDDEPAYLINEYEDTVGKVVKGIKLGWAICNPEDKFDEALGKKIAIGRARKNSVYALFATELGFINSKMVQAFLEQEADYFKANPESHIAAYKRKK